LFVDPDPKSRNDKTFCFWAEDTEPVVADLVDLIGHSWEKARGGREPLVSIAPMRYHQINSLDLYEDLSRRMAANGWELRAEAVESVGADEQGAYAVCGSEKVRARWVLDSRPPQRDLAQPDLAQSFYGWVVETDFPWQSDAGVTLMDLEVPQDGATQFVYMLPYAENRVLVELTRFGTAILEAELAEQRLRDYLKAALPDQAAYRIVHREQGIIPMSEHRSERRSALSERRSALSERRSALSERHPLHGVVSIGTRNNALKPSTGYAFKTMHQQARDLASHLAAQAVDNLTQAAKPWNPPRQHPRYAFLDGLLLHILRRRPHQGKAIFEELFAGTPLPSVLRFMDEKSTWQDDMRMLMHLPWKPFLVALWERHVGWPLRLLLLALLLMGLQALPSVYTVVANLGLVLGMVMLGLPHGAVDHLLQSGRFQRLPTPTMVLVYIGLGLLMLWFWFLWPWWSLLFFVGYSAWHFGQADGRSWGMNRFLSLAWGLSVLAYITGTHPEETSNIVQAMTKQDPTWSLSVGFMAIWAVVGVYRRQSALVWTSLWLMIASQLPLMHAFGLYFIGQHSRTGWRDLRRGLQLSSPTLWRAALPFHTGAWLLLGMFYTFKDWLPPLDFGPEGSFFVFLACLSFPHVVTMHRFYIAQHPNRQRSESSENSQHGERRGGL
jgi:lycopene beta-cyclase